MLAGEQRNIVAAILLSSDILNPVDSVSVKPQHVDFASHVHLSFGVAADAHYRIGNTERVNLIDDMSLLTQFPRNCRGPA